MKLEVRIGGSASLTAGERARTVELEREGGRLQAKLDGQPLEADVAEIAPGVYSILLGGRAWEVRVEPQGPALRVSTGDAEFDARVRDPRVWRGRGGGALELEGRQQVTAPMPGKVVRVLVRQGEEVQARQGLLVVEAMKMQNEIRSPKSGVVERLLVAEGQAVNAGDVLAVVA